MERNRQPCSLDEVIMIDAMLAEFSLTQRHEATKSGNVLCGFVPLCEKAGLSLLP